MKHPDARIWLCCIGLLIASMPSGANPSREATTVQETPVREAPSFSANPITRLPANTPVEILRRQRGWYQAKVHNLKGWLPLLAVRLAQRPIDKKGVGSVGKLLSAFTSGNRAITASTGVRGLKAQDLQRAQPNFDALNRLMKYSVSDEEARQWARQNNLHDHNIPYPEVTHD